MQTIRFNLSNIQQCSEEISLCLGYFDGIHLGHQELIKKAVESKYKSAVLTFDFKKNFSFKNKNHITSLDDKEKILSELGVDYLFVLEFDEEVMNLTFDDFINCVLLKLNAKELIVGNDFRFGKDALGNVDSLIEKSNFYSVIVIDELKINDTKIGTSYIISLIQKGNMKEVKQLLGRFYSITGVVEEGFSLGHKYDFPTANLNLNNYIKPRNGVYLCSVVIDNIEYYGMCNIGRHPTVNELLIDLIEVNIFDFNKNIYNNEIKVLLIDFIRDEKQFDSIDDLYVQLKKDKIKCKNIIKSINC